jgi:hypothetical protein
VKQGFELKLTVSKGQWWFSWTIKRDEDDDVDAQMAADDAERVEDAEY